jgi:O-antigen biosynthesis protein WbqP
MPRPLEIVLALVLSLIALPICLLIAPAVRFSSPGPALYWSRRVGLDEAPFWMPKFRSMRTDTPDLPKDLLADPQQWLTGVGAFLRRSSLDELPQLYSVLKGDMALVGPRPALVNQIDLIAARRAVGANDVRPGITGWAQINGRDELSNEAKVEYDRQYCARRSLIFDMKILFVTAFYVIRRKDVAH